MSEFHQVAIPSSRENDAGTVVQCSACCGKRHAVLIALLIAPLLACICACADSRDEAKIELELKNGEKPIVITARTLFEEYHANEVAADAKYKGRMLEVSGEVGRIAKNSIDDRMYLALDGQVFESVRCYFSDEHGFELASITKGQKVTVIGRGGGEGQVRGCRLRKTK